MFKVCFHPSATAVDGRWLPGQASDIGRRLLGQPQSQPNYIQAEPFKLSTTQQDAMSLIEVHSADASYAVNTHNADASNTADALMAADQEQQKANGQTQRHHAQPASNAAFQAAHPDSDASKASQTWRNQSLATSQAEALPMTGLGVDGMSERLGRVALANEHRKVIRQEPNSHVSLSCSQYLVYVGTSVQLMQAVEVTDFVPKSSLIPLQWPHLIEQVLVYTFAVSAALALINMAPIWYLDGEAALSSAVRLRSHSDMFYSSVKQPSQHWGRLLRCVLGVGSSVFVCVLSLHMVRLFGYDAKLGHLLHTLGKLLSFVLT